MPWPAGVPRTAETRQKIGAAQAGRAYPNRRYQMRPCRTCGKQFRGNSARHWYCSPECKATARYEMRSVISDAEYRLLFARQGGRCAICETLKPGGPKTHDKFFADHDHATGAARGLLCLQCNVALGNFGDDPKRLLRAAAYVARGVTELNKLAATPGRPSTVTAICRTCATGFHAKPSVIASGGGVYCSKDCFHRGRWGRPHPRLGIPNPERWPPKEAACAGCGETFQYRGKQRRYCSRSCAARHRRAPSGLFG